MAKQLKSAVGNTPVLIEPGVGSGDISETAYFMAEKRGFAPGGELEDWLNAENVIASKQKRGVKPFLVVKS